MNTSEYNKALEITNEYLKNSVGYSSYEPSSAADQQIIRQNNIIICLLEQIIQKINEKVITDLTADLTKLSIGSKKPTPKTKDKYTFTYYK